MTQLARTETGGPAGTGHEQGLAAYQARAAALATVREAIDASDKWGTFLENLQARGLPEARVRQIVDVPVPMDLHLHSTHSDGQVPAQKLAWLARVMGLRTIALADHDSLSGTRDLYGEAMLLGLAAIPAVELSTGQSGLEILVYFPDAGRFFDFLTTPRGSRFLQYLEKKQAAVHETTLQVLASVNRCL
ncbi:MAG: PHP domain-containing protein, partial [Planctomycetota bacterium]|nr:PHP domain-containing protein [Planctomycetota bacterium]